MTLFILFFLQVARNILNSNARREDEARYQNEGCFAYLFIPNMSDFLIKIRKIRETYHLPLALDNCSSNVSSC